jgi:hypothetical protein
MSLRDAQRRSNLGRFCAVLIEIASPLRDSQ